MQELDLSRSINFVSLIIIIGIFEGFFIGTYLVLKKSVKHNANRYLGSLVFTITLIFLPGFIYRIGLLPTLPHVVHLDYLSYFLFGPLALFYVRSCSQKDFKLTPKMWMHFLPFLLSIIYLLPFYIQPAEAKLQAFAAVFLRGDGGVPIWYDMVRLLHPTVYLLLCLQVVRQYKNHLTNETSSIDVSFHRWLIFFCGFLLIPLLTAFMFWTIPHHFVIIVITFLLLFIFIMAIHITIFVKPEIFHQFPHQMLIPDSIEEKQVKYENSTLQSSRKDKYVEQVVNFMTTQKPYLKPTLTLSELATQINIPAHHLSQVINEKLECNFLDFVNQYRVKEAQELLTNPNNENYTIISIAYDAGFNSKSTFYAAFKKQALMTPSQYRKKHSALNSSQPLS
ncbi:MAG: helix-turn-helix domain-containing protein [Saprospiraceae bacterium]